VSLENTWSWHDVISPYTSVDERNENFRSQTSRVSLQTWNEIRRSIRSSGTISTYNANVTLQEPTLGASKLPRTSRPTPQKTGIVRRDDIRSLRTYRFDSLVSPRTRPPSCRQSDGLVDLQQPRVMYSGRRDETLGTNVLRRCAPHDGRLTRACSVFFYARTYRIIFTRAYTHTHTHASFAANRDRMTRVSAGRRRGYTHETACANTRVSHSAGVYGSWTARVRRNAHVSYGREKEKKQKARGTVRFRRQ